MMDRGRAIMSAPFPREYRASGVLLHVTSLPSRHGIGDLGPSARAWIDRLADAGQSWWQSLPLGPAGYGNSPYHPLSTFAGNELLLSPEDLIGDGLLRPGDCAGSLFSTTAVDYAVVTQFKRRLLETAWSNFTAGGRADLRRAFSEFCEREAHWQDDYALFRALKARFGSASYLDTRAWFEALPDQQRQNMRNCLKRHTGVSGDVAPALIQLAWGSAAELAIAALQDLLDLGSDALMNQPGQAEGNWQWRCAAATLTPVVWRWLRDLTLASDRALVVAQNPGPTGWRSSRRRAPSSGGRHKEVPCVSVSPPITAGST